MLRSKLLLNVTLFIVIVLLGMKLYSSLSKPMPEDSGIAQKQVLTQEQNKQEIEASDNKKDLYDSNVIVQKDLFRQTRTEPLPDEIKPGNPSMPPPKLVGITIIGDETKAFLEDPLTKTTRPYREKDSIAGFTVNEIHNDKVILLRGAEKIEVGLIKVKTIEGAKPASGISQPTPNVPDAVVPPHPLVQQPQQFSPPQPHAPAQQVLPQPQVLTPPKPVYIPPRQASPLPPAKSN